MGSETIVAVFDTAQEAESAARALEAVGVPPSSIQRYSRDDPSHTEESSPGDRGRQGFWSWLLGEEGEYPSHQTLYERTYESGGVVVTAIVPENEADKVVSTLESHNPVDIEQRASQYGLTGSAQGSDWTAQKGSAVAADRPASSPDLTAGTASAQAKEQVVPLAEEKLEIGKRTVQAGTARVRRYAVERPVEEQIRLRNETVSIERRPASGSTTVAPDAFTDKVVEVTETREEPVVSKTARVVEEVVVGKRGEERTETVRETVRREEVEVDDAGRTGTNKTSTGSSDSGMTGTGTSGGSTSERR